MAIGLRAKNMEQAEYHPDRLLDTLIDRLTLKNDAALARFLDVDPPVISKIRHRKMTVSAALLLRMHDLSEIAVNELRELMGVPRVESEQPGFQGNAVAMAG